MKSEKGITLTSLIIYVVALILTVGFLSTISTHFYANTNYIMDNGKYISEFNKFNMYFIEDVKNNSEVYSIDQNKIVFADGVTYTYSNGYVYRNKAEICRNIENCSFEQNIQTDENNFNKNIIQVNMKIKGSNTFETQNEYVLKYW